MTETERAWSARVREWRASGLSAPEYARGLGFAASTLQWWASRLRRVTRSDRGTVRMARVVAPRAAAPLTVRVGLAQVEVGIGFDRTLLREVVDALGGSR
jgi:hypothetical protein